ncbi:MAG: alpha/beta fold hydrolase [bacterium]|nr:alpha/beta fold hydrolase [bacterium]
MSNLITKAFSSHPVLSWSFVGLVVAALACIVVLLIVWKLLYGVVGTRVGEAYNDPGDYGLVYEDFVCETEDGIHIEGWYIPRENAAATVLMLNGDQGRRDSLLGHARMFNDAGYACATFDYRHHGKSGDDAITYGAREKYDVIAATEYLQEKGFIEGKFIVFGISMGASAALMTAPDLSGVDGYILNCAYAEFDIAFRNGIENMGFPQFPFYYIARMFFKLLTGVDMKSIRPVDSADELDAPVLVIQAGRDVITRPVNGEMIFEAAEEPKEYAFFPEAEHIVIEDEADNIQNPEYIETVLGFIDKIVNRTVVDD